MYPKEIFAGYLIRNTKVKSKPAQSKHQLTLGRRQRDKGKLDSCHGYTYE